MKKLLLMAVFFNLLFSAAHSKEYSKALRTSLRSYNHACATTISFPAGLSKSTLNQICRGLKKSALCKDVPEKQALQCEDFEKELTEEAGAGVATIECLKGVFDSIVEIKDFIVSIMGFVKDYALKGEKRERTHAAVSEFSDSAELYLAHEYERALAESSHPFKETKAYFEVGKSIFKKLYSVVAGALEDMVEELGCYNQASRSRYICKQISNFVMPPVAAWSAITRGPKYVKKILEGINSSAHKTFGRKSVAMVGEKDLVPYRPSGKSGPYKLKEKRKNEFWNAKSPVVIGKNADGSAAHLTYSFDSEIHQDDVLRFIRTDIGMFNKVRKAYAGKNYTRAELSTKLGISEKQLESFGLRKGLDPDAPYVNVTDLAPEYYRRMVETSEHSGLSDMQVKEINGRLVKDIVLEGVNKDLPDVNAHLDLGNIEFTHKSFDKTPGKFWDTMKTYHDKWDAAATHLHIGVPAQVVNNEKAMAIARALEARIVLQRVASSPFKGSDYRYMQHSALNGQHGNRGFVRIGINEWHRPFASHNIEIRMWNSINHGMDHLEVASHMAREHQRISSIRISPHTLDSAAGNLGGSMELVGKLLKAKGDAAADELLEFSKRIHQQPVTDDIYRQAHELLRKLQIEKKLGPELFLE